MNSEENSDYIRILILGSSGVGLNLIKTYLNELLFEEVFWYGYKTFESLEKLESGEIIKVKFSVLNVPVHGRELNSSRKTFGAILVVDLTDPKSFEIVKSNVSRVLGNKYMYITILEYKDKKAKEFKINSDEVRQFAQDNNFDYQTLLSDDKGNTVKIIKDIIEKTYKFKESIINQRKKIYQEKKVEKEKEDKKEKKVKKCFWCFKCCCP